MSSDPKRFTHTDVFTGEEFKSRVEHHYEFNDGQPVAPKVEIRRPTVRQRIENLLNRGVDPLAYYVGHEGVDMDVPDDPESPLTQSEQNYVDMVAAELAEQAPLPDEGLPRPSPVQASQPAPAASPGQVSSPAPGPSPSPAAPPAGPGGSTVPT